MFLVFMEMLTPKGSKRKLKMCDSIEQGKEICEKAAEKYTSSVVWSDDTKGYVDIPGSSHSGKQYYFKCEVFKPSVFNITFKGKAAGKSKKQNHSVA